MSAQPEPFTVDCASFSTIAMILVVGGSRSSLSYIWTETSLYPTFADGGVNASHRILLEALQPQSRPIGCARCFHRGRGYWIVRASSPRMRGTRLNTHGSSIRASRPSKYFGSWRATGY